MNTVVPIYYQIKQEIKSWITNKEFVSGERLPSVSQLAEKFNVNRLTIRHAISQLVQEGFLISKRGQGTFITNNDDLINSFTFEYTGVMDDLIHRTSDVQTKSVSISKVLAPKRIKAKLDLPDTQKEVIQITRVRLFKDRMLTYTINYLPSEIGQRITERDLYERRLLEILEQDFGIEFKDAVQTIEASFADMGVAKQLGIAAGSPVLFVERIMYSQKSKPVELYQAFCRGDLYKYILRFRQVKRKEGSRWIHRPEFPSRSSL